MSSPDFDPGTLEELGEFSDAAAYGLPLARLSDVADPMRWRAWAIACAEADKAKLACAAAERQRKIDVAEAASRGVALALPWGMADPVTAAILALHNAEQLERNAALAAEASARDRLRGGDLRAFGRPGALRSPFAWVGAHEWQAHPRGEGGGANLNTIGGTQYWALHLHDTVGVPAAQAAIAYRLRDELGAPGRLAIGRFLAGVERDHGEDAEILATLWQDIADRLSAGRLLAFRDGANLSADDFAPGGRVADLGVAHDAQILIRPPAPPRRAPVAKDAEAFRSDQAAPASLAERLRLFGPDALLSSAEWAEMRGLSERTVDRERELGDGAPYIRVSFKKVCYRYGDCLEFLRRRRVGAFEGCAA